MQKVAKPFMTQGTKVRTESINDLIYDIECRRQKVTFETQTILLEDDNGFDGPNFGARSAGRISQQPTHHTLRTQWTKSLVGWQVQVNLIGQP